jgi:CheY-like chemotaxis protein
VSKILVIEDDENIRCNVLDLLEAEGMTGLGAADGRRGIELAVQQLPALIICDVTMPEVDGYEVLETLSERPETAVIPFIFLSARAERCDVRKGMSLGADDYLTKPFTRLELLETIRARLLRHRRRVEARGPSARERRVEARGPSARERKEDAPASSPVRSEPPASTPAAPREAARTPTPLPAVPPSAQATPTLLPMGEPRVPKHKRAVASRGPTSTQLRDENSPAAKRTVPVPDPNIALSRDDF